MSDVRARMTSLARESSGARHSESGFLDSASDFDVLDRDGAFSNPTSSYCRDVPDDDSLLGSTLVELERRRGHAIRRVCQLVSEEPRPAQPLRIVFIGKHGSGKSSLINSIGAAFSQDRWREYAYTGFHGGAEPITIFTQRFEKCCNSRGDRYKTVPLPTLIDVAGKMDVGDDKMDELLRLIFYGHIQEDSAVQEAFEFCERHTREEIREQYRREYPAMRVDRVVFVASADDGVPEKLMASVMRAARPAHYTGVRRTIPVFGVMTKKDKVKDLSGSEFKERRRLMMTSLGLHANRFLVCSNYCDDIDPDSRRSARSDPRIDVPIVEFFTQVCDPALRVIQDQERLPGSQTGGQTNSRSNSGQGQGLRIGEGQDPFGDLDPRAAMAGVAMVTFVVVFVVVSFVFSVFGKDTLGEAVREKCNRGEFRSDRSLRDLCSSHPPSSPAWGALVTALTLSTIVTAIYYVIRRRNVENMTRENKEK